MFLREWKKDGYFITTNKAKLQINRIHAFLTNSYWAKGISLELVKESINHSICFGLFHHEKQIGLARMITDGITFGYLCDVYVEAEYRGQGLGKWLVETLFANPEFHRLRRSVLATSDAHGLYSQIGFNPVLKPEFLMERLNLDAYLKATSN